MQRIAVCVSGSRPHAIADTAMPALVCVWMTHPTSWRAAWRHHDCTDHHFARRLIGEVQETGPDRDVEDGLLTRRVQNALRSWASKTPDGGEEIEQ